MGIRTKSEISVRVSETDAVRIVYYGNFLTYFEVARFDHLNSNGCTSDEISEFLYESYIVEVQCSYKSPVRALETIIIETNIEEMGAKSFTFKYKVTSKATDIVIAEGKTIGVFVDSANKSRSIPEWFRTKLTIL